MLKTKHFLFFIFVTALTSCASVSDPNTNELASDKLWQQEKYKKALELIQPAAEQGKPWAQLRLGIAYEYGQGLPQDYSKALQWYKKTAVQTKDDAWADGLPLLSAGEEGFFNQNNDAKVAQFLIARIYSADIDGIKKNLAEAWLWANFVNTQNNGSDLLYCCENSILRKRKIEGHRIQSLLTDIESKLGPEKKEQLLEVSKSWKPY